LLLFINKINNILPLWIKIRNIYPVKYYINARIDAISRVYKYYINFNKNPFIYKYTWMLKNKNINLNLMNNASKILLQFNNFTSLSKKNKKNNYYCKIYKANWKITKFGICFTIEANRFLRKMIRFIVGNLILIGYNKLTLKRFEEILLDNINNKNKILAPAHGLFLYNIKYLKNIIRN